MSSRAFTVFQDTPSSPTTPVLSPSISAKSFNVHQQQSTALTCLDKENVHPLTGERTGPSMNAIHMSKKRKTSVLAAKVQVMKELDCSQGDAKKKRISSTTISTTKGKKSVKKATSSSTTTTKKPTKKPSRRVSPLPKVDEELDVDKEKERRRLSQAEIDSRCYELTVQPLADLSQAYEQSREAASIEEPSIDEGRIKFRSIKESSVEPEIRDYPCPSAAALSSCPPPGSKTTSTGHKETFSTPERKRIYSAFTFTSPSPTSQRFRTVNRTNSSSKDSVHPDTP